MNRYSMRAVMVTPLLRPQTTFRMASEAFAPALAELEAMSGRITLDPLLQSAPIQIQLHDTADDFADFAALLRNEAWGRTRVFLRCSADVSVDLDEITGVEKGPEGSRDLTVTADGLADSLLQAALEQAVLDLLCVANLARPGAIACQFPAIGVTELSKNSYTVRAKSHTEIGSIDEITYFWPEDWPALQSVPVHQLWKWFQSLPGHEDRFLKGRVGRAVTALLSIMTSSSETPVDLLLPLLGLEALFGEHRRGKDRRGGDQVIDRRSQLLLGKRRSNKKAFKQLYVLRSRLVHGDVDLPMPYWPADGSDEFDEFNTNFYDANVLAVAILIASVQRLAMHNVTELDDDNLDEAMAGFGPEGSRSQSTS